MRVGVIRGDLPGSIFVSDLEPTSQTDPSIEHGQSRYLSRPNVTNIQTYLTAQGLTASPTALITACNPVGGPVNVSSATITGVTGLSGATATQVSAIADLLAPRFVETNVAKKSFLFGALHGLQSASFNPDPNRFSAGPAIAVVADDGVTAFTVATPVLTSAAIASNVLTLTGTGLAEYGDYAVINNDLHVKVGSVGLKDKQITLAGGTLGATSITIPMALCPTAASGTSVQLLVNGMVTAAINIT